MKEKEQYELNDILLLKENDYSDFMICYYYLRQYITDIKKKKFNSESVTELRALTDKFIHFNPEQQIFEDNLTGDLRTLAERMEELCIKTEFGESGESEYTLNFIQQKLYSSFSKVFNEWNKRFRSAKVELLDFDGLINYDNSNRKRVISIIQDAIELINADTTLTTKAKNKIISYLSNAITELNNPKTNWHKIFTITTQAIIALGALSTVVSGIDSAAGNKLFEAKKKVETVNEIIVKSSINLNYYNVENTFILNNPVEIENNKIQLLEENNNDFQSEDSK